MKCPVSYVLNFRGWIKLIYDKIILIYSVKNAFNPTSEVQNIENGVFQNAPFASTPFANGSFPNGDKSCIWAVLCLLKSEEKKTRHVPKLAISEKSTILVLSSSNLVKIITS